MNLISSPLSSLKPIKNPVEQIRKSPRHTMSQIAFLSRSRCLRCRSFKPYADFSEILVAVTSMTKSIKTHLQYRPKRPNTATKVAGYNDKRLYQQDIDDSGTP